MKRADFRQRIRNTALLIQNLHGGELFCVPAIQIRDRDCHRRPFILGESVEVIGVLFRALAGAQIVTGESIDQCAADVGVARPCIAAERHFFVDAENIIHGHV